MTLISFDLTENERKKEFDIDPENPYYTIVFKGSGHNSSKDDSGAFGILIFTRLIYGKNPISKELHFTPKTLSEINLGESIPTEIDLNTEKLIFEIQERNTIKDPRLTFEIRLGRETINVFSPLNDFDDFLSNRVNSKILFSAPFGSGKSFFLDYYFNQSRKNDYQIFTLYPVNYSVAQNEDIFRYIKTDILFQLLACDVEFEKEEVNITKTFQEYTYLNPKKTVFSFLKNISRLNSKTELLAKAIDTLNEFLKPILDYHSKQQINDKQKAKDYLEEIHDKEGSLFEDNFYTQLIRQLLESLKANTSKPNILIIEDLDRMDPDHIFRILNVISAHYDIYKFSEEEFPNKFGFDKIILVGDVQNIQHIFHHKYGKDTDFRGYINKFFSSRPFVYDNKKQIDYFITNTYKRLSNSKRINPYNQSLIQLLKILNQFELISLREIIKIHETDFNNFHVELGANEPLMNLSPYTKALKYLTMLFGESDLLQKIDKIQNSSNLEFRNIMVDTKYLLAALGKQNQTEYFAVFRDSIYKFNYHEHYDYKSYIDVYDVKRYNKEGEEIQMNLEFNGIDFLDLLKENILRISEIERKVER